MNLTNQTTLTTTLYLKCFFIHVSRNTTIQTTHETQEETTRMKSTGYQIVKECKHSHVMTRDTCNIEYPHAYTSKKNKK